jgi:hypothetical protein
MSMVFELLELPLEVLLDLLLEPQAATASAAASSPKTVTALRDLIVLLSTPHPGAF